MKDARALEDYIVMDLFDKAQVIACTPVISAGRMMRNRQFSTVFIDEAAQALEPMCWIPVTLSNRVIFAGDHFQLPPKKKKKKAEEEGLKETLFEHCMHIPGIAVMLNTQYRMHEWIMNYSSRKFYQNELKADATVKDHLLSNDPAHYLLNVPVEFIDTAGCGYTEITNPESLSISNPEEAQLLLKHLKLVLQQYTLVPDNKPIRIGVISPYKEQVQYLTQLISTDEELKPYASQLAVKTVDGFQGQEKDIIYISLVRSNEKMEIGFLNDIRRMNVALTRAKKKLIVIGDSATLGNHPFYKEFLDYTERIMAYKSAWEFAGE